MNCSLQACLYRRQMLEDKEVDLDDENSSWIQVEAVDEEITSLLEMLRSFDDVEMEVIDEKEPPFEYSGEK